MSQNEGVPCTAFFVNEKLHECSNKLATVCISKCFYCVYLNSVRCC